jgi:hypothetical protein
MKGSDKDYEKSNKIEAVCLNCFSKKEYAALLADGNRQRLAQALINYLCEKFHIPMASVFVTNTPQPHSTGYSGKLKSKTFGTYATGLRKITIYNTTAIKKQTISIKVFADTLLHEFMHHYDCEKLKIASLHTAGFYKRISDLQRKLSE